MSFGASSFGSATFGSGPNQGSSAPADFVADLSVSVDNATLSSGAAVAGAASATATETATLSTSATNVVSPSLTQTCPFSGSGTGGVSTGCSVMHTASTSLTIAVGNSVIANSTENLDDTTLVSFATFGSPLPMLFADMTVSIDNATMISTVTNLGGQRFPEPVRPRFLPIRIKQPNAHS